LNQYGLKEWVEQEEELDIRDWFSVKAPAQLMKAIESLPSASREAIRQEYLVVCDLEARIKSLELSIKARVGSLGWMRLLQTLPGVGLILGATIWLEDRSCQAISLRAAFGCLRGPCSPACSPVAVRPGAVLHRKPAISI
jgi:transposase